MITSRARPTKFLQLAAVSALALCATSPALAQTASPAAAAESTAGNSSARSDDIVVTAQRREERLQNVPISLSALGSAQLSSRGAADITALVGAVPGLTISSFAGVNASNLVAIRGINGQPLPIGAGQATAIYLDGVYLSRPDAAFFSLDDVQRVEVLRGPQGTLYGRNATAGAINIITRDPGDRLEGGLDANYGNYNAVNVRGSLRGPLGGGFSAGVSGSYNRHDGYFINSVTGNRIGKQEAYTVRGKLGYTDPSGDFHAVLAGDSSRNAQEQVFKGGYQLSPTVVYTGIGDPKFVSSDAISESQAWGAVIRSEGVSLTMNYTASPELVLTSISSYRKVTTDTQYDGDATASSLILSSSFNSSKAFNQELRAVYTGNAFRLTAGFNYFHEDALFALGARSPALPVLRTSPVDTSNLKAWALFAQAEYDVVSNLTFVAGLRYNNEHRDFTVDFTKAPVPGPFNSGKVSDTAFLPSFGVNFKAAPDVLLYAKVSKGYQAPGFNFLPAAALAPNTFRPEKLWAYEAGIKSEFMDRKVTFNAAAFRYEYKDIQIRSVTGVNITTVDNAASAKVQGFEASLALRPATGFTLSGQVTYLDNKYKSFCQFISAGAPQGSDPLCGTGFADRSGNRLNLAPTWSGGIDATYVAELGSGRLTLNANYAWESNVFYTTANEPLVSSGGWTKLGARVAYKLANGPEIYVFGKNLTDKRYIAYGARLNATLMPLGISEPRTYGVGVSYHF